MLFSRYLIILILFILQVAFIWFVVSLLQQYYWWVRLAFYLIEIFIFFHIMNKKESPDFKIPWIIIFIIFPVVGLVIWLFFRNHRLKRSHLRKLTEMDLMLYPYFKTNDKERNQMNVDIPEYVTHFNYLENLTHFKSYNDSHIEYFKSGESYFLDMINEMKKAKEFIYIEFFIIHRGKFKYKLLHELLLGI
jgi:cardiolipin synthase